MGHKLSTQPANDMAVEAQKTIDEVMKSFEDKRQLFLDNLSLKRGDNAADKNIEVTGGRTVMEYTNIFYTERIGPNSEMTGAIGDFFQAADSSIDSHNTDAQHSAIQGCKSLIMGAINGILGDTSIGVREVSAFNIIFLCNSFVRIDYKFYQQNIDVVKYLAAVRSTARLIVCELAILPIENMHPSEITYLLSQSLNFDASDPNLALAQLGEVQCNLIQLSVMTKMLQQFLIQEDSNTSAGELNGDYIEQKSKGLIALSKNVESVLVEISKSTFPKTLKVSDSSNKLSLSKEIALRDTHTDANLDALGVTIFLTKLQKEWLDSSPKKQDTIWNQNGTMDLKFIQVVKNKFQEFHIAFVDIIHDDKEFSVSDTFENWYDSHKIDYAMWWFTFCKNANANTYQVICPSHELVLAKVKGTIKWSKKVGDSINSGEELCMIGVENSVKASAKGVLAKILHQDGEEVNANMSICVIVAKPNEVDMFKGNYPSHTLVLMTDESAISQWSKKVGDKIAVEDKLYSTAENTTVVAPPGSGGVLAKILKPPGEKKVEAGTPICMTVVEKKYVDMFEDAVVSDEKVEINESTVDKAVFLSRDNWVSTILGDDYDEEDVNCSEYIIQRALDNINGEGKSKNKKKTIDTVSHLQMKRALLNLKFPLEPLSETDIQKTELNVSSIRFRPDGRPII